MYRYESRVLLSDSVNGEQFHFALVFGTPNRSRAITMAQEEFPESVVVEVTHVRVED